MTLKELAAAHDRLAEQLKTARDLNDGFRDEVRVLRLQLSKAQTETDETRVKFSDLKTRLFSSERANEFMRGYLARVTEDDQVREELVQVGDPMGESHLVPKRKSTPHPRPDDPRSSNEEMFLQQQGVDRGRSRAKHWITY